MEGVPIREVLRAVRQLLEGALSGRTRDEDAASATRELAAWLSTEADRLGAAPPPEPVPEPARQPDGVEPELVAMTLSIGGAEAPVEVPFVEGSGSTAAVGEIVPVPPAGRPPAPAERTSEPIWARRRPDDWPAVLGRVARRARLKARGCELAARRRRGEGEDREAEEDLRRRSSALPDVSLWPLDRGSPLPEPEVLDVCARCYEVVAEAADLVGSLPGFATGEDEPPLELLELTAEAQSALRAALYEADAGDDVDQLDLFGWVRAQGYVHRIYVPRFMRTDDVANPQRWHDLSARIESLGERLQASEQDARERRRLTSDLNHRVDELRLAGSTGERVAAWRPILRILESWVTAGRSPTRREICEPLVSVLDDMPAEVRVPEAAQSVLAAVDEMVARASSAAAPRAEPPSEEPSDEVAAARTLLAGKVVVLIGGELRPRERDRLVRDLGLAELRWITTRPHRSIDPLVRAVRKPDVDLVVVMVRWSDHAFGELRRHAEEAGIPFVALRAGYGSNRFAHDVLEQVSGRLGGASPR